MACQHRNCQVDLTSSQQHPCTCSKQGFRRNVLEDVRVTHLLPLKRLCLLLCLEALRKAGKRSLLLRLRVHTTTVAYFPLPGNG